MIKINLLPVRKAKRKIAEPGIKDVYIGAGAVLALIAAVVFAVDMPRRGEFKKLEAGNEEQQRDVNRMQAGLKGFAELKLAAEEAQKRGDAINTLLAAKIVPAYILHELGEILTAGKLPTMSEEMARRTGSGPDSDPNRRLALDWDPKHVWLSSFIDNQGQFKLEGGAQSDGDVNQFAKRLQASIYFQDVTPQRSERVTEQGSNTSYYKFTIAGRLVY